MMMIQITPKKKEKLSELVEGILHDAGKIMQCLESLDPAEEYGERGRMGMRSSRYGMPEEGDEMEKDYGERRRRY